MMMMMKKDKCLRETTREMWPYLICQLSLDCCKFTGRNSR